MDPLVELLWFIDEIREKGQNADKMLLYVRSVTTLGKLYRDILGELRENAYKDKQKCFNNRLVSVYHAGLVNSDQKQLISVFSKPDSVVRLVICTVAFGLGVNIPDIRAVVHWGACDSLLQYWQEVGRAGRDGKFSVAYYYVTRTSLIHVNEDMKKVCDSINKGQKDCFRQSILSSMIGATVCTKNNNCDKKCEQCQCSMCRCCSICESKCACSFLKE